MGLFEASPSETQQHTNPTTSRLSSTSTPRSSRVQREDLPERSDGREVSEVRNTHIPAEAPGEYRD